MTKILGLDISTSIVGICVLEKETGKIVDLTHLDLKKPKNLTFWQKLDIVENFFNQNPLYQDIDIFGVEKYLMGFGAGGSSILTLMTLARFNTAICVFLRKKYKVEPIEISAPTARKLCGIKTIPVKLCGIKVKEQVFQHALKNDFINHSFPLKKRGKKGQLPKIVDWARDEIDSWIIAKAISLQK